MRSLWSPEAEDALLAILIRLNAFSAGAGDRFAERVRRRVEALERYPLMGRLVPEYAVAEIREVVEPPYRIFYEVFPDRVEVFAIRHGRERLPRE